MTNDVERQRVALAIIEKDGKFLIAQRKAEGSFASLWELPGGKCRKGEEPISCVVRDVREETGLEVCADTSAVIVEHAYSGLTVELHAFFCRVLSGEAAALESQAIAWIAWDAIPDYSFPAANRELFVEARRLRNLARPDAAVL
jgi:mutator protein MutT